MSELRSRLKRHIERRNKSAGLEEAQGADSFWDWYGSSLEHYEGTFHSLFPGQHHPLLNFREQHLRDGKPLVALDLMSEGQALRDLSPTRGLAVTLTDQRFAADKTRDQDKIDVIAGDVLSSRIWQKVLDWVEHNGGSQHTFDLILERASAGLLDMPHDPTFLYQLVENLYSVLNADGGMMVVELSSQTNEDLALWTKQLQQLAHLEVACSVVQVHNPVFKLIRHEGAPDKLPPPQL